MKACNNLMALKARNSFKSHKVRKIWGQFQEGKKVKARKARKKMKARTKQRHEST